jgi:hypothetical protein
MFLNIEIPVLIRFFSISITFPELTTIGFIRVEIWLMTARKKKVLKRRIYIVCFLLFPVLSQNNKKLFEIFRARFYQTSKPNKGIINSCV